MPRNQPARSRNAAVATLGAALFVSSTLLTRPAAAHDVPPGTDMLVTPGLPGPSPTPTYDDVNLPAGFFGGGSLAFTGRIYFIGTPLNGTNVFGADTIVRRTTIAMLPTVGSVDTVPIEICALSLVSANPMTVNFGGPTSQYSVRACLSSVQTQPQGSMTLRHSHTNGGTFDSTLPVRARLTFTRVSGTSGLPSVVLDPAPVVTLMTSNAPWAHNPDPSLGIIQSPGATVDHDCNAATPPIICGPTTPNFTIGVLANMPTKKCLTSEEEMLAKHGVLPNETIGPDSDNDGIHDKADNCVNVFNPLQEDADHDCVGDACTLTGGTSVPTMPTWGIAALIGALISCGAYAIYRMRSTPRGAHG